MCKPKKVLVTLTEELIPRLTMQAERCGLSRSRLIEEVVVGYLGDANRERI